LKRAKTLMIQGTGSGVGKSVITAALCRIFFQDGYSTAPFKAQNMALNSFVTRDGGEIGRAQAVQAAAAKIEPTVDMNPVLMKPSSDRRAQIILHGKPIGNFSAAEYSSHKKKLFAKVTGSLKKLRSEYEVVVIEGAGSPAEVNLRKKDIVNMSIAKHSQTPVILVGDIDKGGVLAWLVGTLDLLEKDERKLVKGFIINKFRGDRRLFSGGVKYLEKKTGIKVLGVLPYLHDIDVPEEDSVPLEYNKTINKNAAIKAAVIRLPHISNFTDFDAISHEPDIDLYYVQKPEELDDKDIIFLPGTKSTISDFLWLKKTGFTLKLKSIAEKGNITIAGICGGYQILGSEILDKYNIESRNDKTIGLNLLPVITSMEKNKQLRQVHAKDINTGIEVHGYEIHHGNTVLAPGAHPVFKFIKGTKGFDGASTHDSRVWGTYIHGVFDNAEFRTSFLNIVRRRKNLPALSISGYDPEKGINELAAAVRKYLDMKIIYSILEKGI
jgi:adenosylcobyric acid synthase